MKKRCLSFALAFLFGMASSFANPTSQTTIDQTGDITPPTIVCLNGLAVNIMPTGMISLWATDFLQYTEDDVTPTAQIRLGIRKAGTGTGFPVDPTGQPITNLIYDCSELGVHDVELWAIDLSGNASYCTSALIVQDNAGNCSGTWNPGGTVCLQEWCAHDGVEEASLIISSPSPFAPPLFWTLSNDAGCWDLPNSPIAPDMQVSLYKDDNPLNGVTSYDLVLLSQHIHGIQPFTSPFQWIAADANKDNVVDIQDSIEFVRLITGVYTELPNNSSWRFVRADYVFPQPNPLSPLIPEFVTVGELSDSVAFLFYGVKIGDLSCSIPTGPICTKQVCDNEPISGATITITMDSVNFVPPIFFNISNQNGCGSPPSNFPFAYPITVTASMDLDPLNGVNTYDLILLSHHIDGSQPFTEPWQYIAADANHDNLVDIQDSIELRKLIIGEYMELPNNTSWRFVPSDYVFPTLNPFTQAFPESVTITNPFSNTPISFVGIKIGDLNCSSVSAIPENPAVLSSISLSPNPTADGATLSLSLEESATVRCQVLDLSGKMVFENETQLPSGAQTIDIPASSIQHAGVYFWNVLVGDKLASGKLIRM